MLSVSSGLVSGQDESGVKSLEKIVSIRLLHLSGRRMIAGPRSGLVGILSLLG